MSISPAEDFSMLQNIFTPSPFFTPFRHIEETGAPVTVTAAQIEAALTLNAAEPADKLPPEGFLLEISATPASPANLKIAIRGDERGRRYGLQTLSRLLTPQSNDTFTLQPAKIRDWPELALRGTIEGFYGTPWSEADRRDHLEFAARHRLNMYVYAPKDDKYHRAKWRELYPPAQLEGIKNLVELAQELDIDFIYALAPGLSMQYSDDAEHEKLAAKAAQLQEIGVTRFALLFDDIPTELEHEADIAKYGSEPGSAGAAHGEACTRFIEAVSSQADAPASDQGARLIMVPTDYAGVNPSPYREQLAKTMPANALVWWTGSDIVVGEISRADIDSAAASYHRDLLLWDNFPVNDFDFERLFLGPLTGRTNNVSGSALQGITANPMVAATASQLALATVAEWAWNPAHYDPDAAAKRALTTVAGPAASAVAALIGASSSWPPSAPQSAHLQALVDQTLAGEAAAADELRTSLQALTILPQMEDAQGDPTAQRLLAELEPWARAGAQMASAALAALDLLQASAPTREQIDLVANQSQAAQKAEANILRGVIIPFITAVLKRVEPSN